MNDKFKKEYNEILDWAIAEEDKILKNSHLKGLDANREKCKPIHEEMERKIKNLYEKYGIKH